MHRILALALLTGCVTINDRAVYDVAADMPEMNQDCEADKLDEATETSRIVASVGTVFEDGPGTAVGAMCRGVAYARVQAVEWDAVRDSLPGPTRLTWQEIVAALDRLEVSSDAFDVPPSGASFVVEQFVVTDAELALLEEDPLMLVDDIGMAPITNSDSYLMRVQHDFDGTETGDLTAFVTVDTNEVGPLAAVTDSYENDEALQVVTLAEVQLPLTALGEEPYSVSVDLEARLEYVARAGLSLFNGGNGSE